MRKMFSGRLRGVAIGAGYFSQFQYEAWTRIPEVQITATCDLNEDRAAAVQSHFRIPKRYTNWMEMLDRESPDFVDIITPPDTHEEMCAFAAQRGIHVISQKPLAPTIEGAARIVEIAAKCGVRLMVHENWRWQPWYRKLKELQAASAIGQFTHVHVLTRMGDGWGERAYLDRQPFFREYPKLLIYETGVHFIDTFRFLLGEVNHVYAHIRRLNPVIRGEDAAQLFLTFESGATALWDANRYNESELADPRFTFGEIRVDGTAGHLSMDGESNIRMKRLGERATEVEYFREKRNFAGDCVYAVQRHFVECMQFGREFESNGEDYLKTLEVVFAAYASAAHADALRPETATSTEGAE